MKRVIYVLKYAFDILYDIFAHLLFILSIFLSMSKKLFFVFVLIFFVFVLIMTGSSIQKTAQKKFCYAYVFSSVDNTFNLQNKSFLSRKFNASVATLHPKLQVVDKKCLEYVYAYAYSKKHLAETFKDPRRSEVYKKQFEELLNEVYEKEKIYRMQLGQSFWKKMLNKLLAGIYYFASLVGIYVK